MTRLVGNYYFGHMSISSIRIRPESISSYSVLRLAALVLFLISYLRTSQVAFGGGIDLIILSYISFIGLLLILIINLSGKPLVFVWPVLFALLFVFFQATSAAYILLPAITLLLSGSKGCHDSTNGRSATCFPFIFLFVGVGIAAVVHSFIVNGAAPGGLRLLRSQDPNFYAASFLNLYILIIDGRKWVKTTAISLILLSIYLSFSRGALVGFLVFCFLNFLSTKNIGVTRVLAIALLIFTVLFPFFEAFHLLGGNVTDYTADTSRLIDISDASNQVRLNQLRLGIDMVFSNSLYLHGFGSQFDVVLKPHNWFWLISLNFGMAYAIILFCIIVALIATKPINLVIIIAVVVTVSSFLDWAPLATAFYLLVFMSLSIAPARLLLVDARYSSPTSRTNLPGP